MRSGGCCNHEGGDSCLTGTYEISERTGSGIRPEMAEAHIHLLHTDGGDSTEPVSGGQISSYSALHVSGSAFNSIATS